MQMRRRLGVRLAGRRAASPPGLRFAGVIADALHTPDANSSKDASISTLRKHVESLQQPMVDRASAIYPVKIEQKSFAGVAARVITPI